MGYECPYDIPISCLELVLNKAQDLINACVTFIRIHVEGVAHISTCLT